MATRDQVITDEYCLYNADCMEVTRDFPSDSIHLSIYSPPFAGLYQYSSDPSDLSNCKDYHEFLDHYGYVVREIHRLTLPGRMTAVHCQDIPILRNNDHHLMDFPGDIIRLHAANGWKYVARYHVWKEPLTVRNRTMVNSLHHKTLCEDSTRCSIANADYLLIFRRSGDNVVPVSHPTGLTNYAGSRQPPDDILSWRGYKGNQIKNQYSHWVWRQYASAFWDDVRIDRVLPYREAREEQDEKHVHPLQLDIIERAIVLWSNPGEVIWTPFMGVGSEVAGAVMNGRKGVGAELKSTYYRQAVHNVAAVLEESRHERGRADDEIALLPGFAEPEPEPSEAAS